MPFGPGPLAQLPTYAKHGAVYGACRFRTASSRSRNRRFPHSWRGVQRGAGPCSAANVEPNLPIRRPIRRDRRPFGASSVAHRCTQVVHAWIASSTGITMPVNQFPLSVLPSVDLGDAKVYRLRGTADDRSRASFEADQVCQIPADSGSQDFEVDWCPVRVQRGDAAEGFANLCPSELAGFERQRRAGGAATCGRPRRCPPGSMATTASGVKPNFRGAPRPPRISGSDIPAPEKEMPQSPGRRAMSDREEFVAWTQSRLRGAETALHNGDPELRAWRSGRRESRCRYSARGVR